MASGASVTLDTPQVNHLIDVARRYYGLALAIDPIRAMVDAKWDEPLDVAKRELLDVAWALLAILQRSLPELSLDGLDRFSYTADLSPASIKITSSSWRVSHGRPAFARNRLHPLLMSYRTIRRYTQTHRRSSIAWLSMLSTCCRVTSVW